MLFSREKHLADRVFETKDQAAFSELYRLYTRRVQRFLRSRLPREEDAEEIGAEAFLRLWEYLLATPVERPFGVVMGISRNLVADFYRRNPFQGKTVELNDAQEHAVTFRESNPSDATEDVLVQEEVAKELAEISEEARQMFFYHVFDDMKPREIAATMGRTANSVRLSLHRTRVFLQKKISEKKG